MSRMMPLQYLNPSQHGKAAGDLAEEWFVIMDRRLPARLNELSNHSSQRTDCECQPGKLFAARQFLVSPHYLPSL
jgi:hypothetical protein